MKRGVSLQMGSMSNEHNIETDIKDEYLGEEMYNLFVQVLNRPENRSFFDSIRGEYGVLWYLVTQDRPVSAGELKDKLHVVPGRMTDILTALEKKGFIVRRKDETDRRVVRVCLTKDGAQEAMAKRKAIHEEYQGLFDIISPKEAKELIRLLKILLTYNRKIDSEN